MAEQLGLRRAPIAQNRETVKVIPTRPTRDHPPRVIVTPVDESLQHPLSKRDIQLIISVLSREATANLRSVSLLGGRVRSDGAPVFASYRHTGFLRLHAVAPSPWFVEALPTHAAMEFRQYGALIELLSGGGSRVVWPGESLRLFFALGVLLPGLACHRRVQEEGADLEGDVRWLGARAESSWVSEVALRQWLDLLRGRGPA